MSTPDLNSTAVVSDLESALMRSIGQGMQSGNAGNGMLQPEMRLLTEMLNQSNGSESNPSPATGDPSTIASAPSANSADPSASGTNPSTNASDPSGSNGSNPGTSAELGRKEAKLNSALEQNITNRLDNGQSPKNNNGLEQEMNLLIQLLNQNT